MVTTIELTIDINNLITIKNKFMNAIKKILGIVWIILGLLVGYLGVTILGLPKLSSGKQEDLVFGIIILFILTPIIVYGLVKFGWYALQGEYTELN